MGVYEPVFEDFLFREGKTAFHDDVLHAHALSPW